MIDWYLSLETLMIVSFKTLHEFKKEDFWFYIDTLNIRKMGKYIKEEFKMK
jgi:hypothetical protein